MTVNEWAQLMADREAADIASGLRGQSVMELWDVAWEDSEGRLPFQAGYCGRWAREAAAAKEARESLVELVPRITDEEVDQAVLALARRMAVAA